MDGHWFYEGPHGYEESDYNSDRDGVTSHTSDVFQEDVAAEELRDSLS